MWKQLIALISINPFHLRDCVRFQETPTPSASKRRSRWDETPSATPTPAMTPGAMTPTTPHGTPGHSTPMLTPGGSTPVGVKAMGMATPTPGIT